MSLGLSQHAHGTANFHSQFVHSLHHVYYAEQQADEVKRNRELIRYLEKEGIAVDLRGAIVLGEADRIKKLLKDKPLVQTPLLPREKPLLHLAVGLNQKDTVELLLDAGAPIEAADDSEYTPLIDAAFWGRDDIAALLIARGAKLDARTRDGTTPLSEAVRCKQKTTIELLKKHGAKE